MAFSSERIPPIALIVEDDVDALEARKSLFEAEGFLTITASDYQHAIHEFTSSAAIDIVITDIDLGYGPDQQSGFDVAQKCGEIRPDVPVIGYSSAVGEDDVPAERWRVFKGHTINKATRDDTIRATRDRIGQLLKLARESQSRRNGSAMDELMRIEKKYNIEEGDLASLQAFLPGLQLPGRNAFHYNRELAVGDVLEAAGLQLELIRPGSLEVPSLGKKLNICATVAIWIYEEPECYVAELVEHPSLFSYGTTKEDAVEGLLSLMDGFYTDFRDKTVLSHQLVRLREYLTSVLEPADAADD